MMALPHFIGISRAPAIESVMLAHTLASIAEGQGSEATSQASNREQCAVVEPKATYTLP